MGKNLLSALLCSLFAILTQAQSIDVGIGQWTSYLPFQSGHFVTQSSNKIYYATELALLVVDKADRSIQRISKVDGISNVGISVVKYNAPSNTLIVVYDNSAIDLLQEDGIHTLFDISNFQGLIGDKEIYSIYSEGNETAYLAANYGLSKLDLAGNEFSFSTFTGGVPVFAVTLLDGYLYLAAEDGIYRIEENHPFPEDFNQWTKLDESFGFPSTYTSTYVASYHDQLYLSVDDTLFRYDGQNLHALYQEAGFELRYLTTEGERLIAGFYCTNSCSGKVLFFSPDDSFEEAASCTDRPIYAIEDEEGTVWFADGFRNFRFQEKGAESCSILYVNSHYSQNIKEIKAYQDEIWIASGGVRTNYDYLFREDGIFARIDGKWEVFNKNNVEALEGLFDFYDLAIRPDGAVYAASFLDGLVEYDREDFTVYTDANSSLNNAEGDPNRTRVSGLAFDQDTNLWVANHTAERPFSVLRTDGSWQSFKPSGCNETQLLQVVVDQNNYKWFVSGSSTTGILVFDEGDPSDPGDDRCRLITANNSNLPTNRVNCLAVDLEGDVWVGTQQGTIVFECGSSVFDPGCTGSLRIVQQDNFGAYLLETENIRTIAVDGANRKWFGTDNGIFVQSPDGEEQVAFYNVENSPLFDNVINDIEIQQVTGEVYIGTNKGLQSIRGTATEGGVVNSNDVVVFPNPVRPEYDGVIAIKGLARDADVKITDMSGRLVYQTTALGGQAIWDGRDYTGRKAATGVYLVFSTSTQRIENPDAVVAKILFVN